MLRPPVTAKLPSAMNSLLCMRWLMRANSCSENSDARVRSAPPRTGSGLNRRTSTLGWAARPASSASWPIGVEVVDQQAHAHAARGGGAQLARNWRPVRVVRRSGSTGRPAIFSARRISAMRASNASSPSGSRRKPETSRAPSRRRRGGDLRQRRVGDVGDRVGLDRSLDLAPAGRRSRRARPRASADQQAGRARWRPPAARPDGSRERLRHGGRSAWRGLSLATAARLRPRWRRSTTNSDAVAMHSVALTRAAARSS